MQAIVLTKELARFVVETSEEALPPQGLALARDAVVDTIGVAIAGTRDPVGRIAASYVETLQATGAVPVWATGLRSTPVDAAFVNAVCGHALDFDDSLPSLRGHPSVPLCAAGLAMAQGRRIHGRDFLVAYVVALETAGLIGRALGHGHYRRGWHITATAGAFAAATMAARLIGLDRQRTQYALGLAAAQAAGLVSNFGTMAKPFQAGHAARAGVSAALLAEKGMTAAEDVLDGKDGFLAMYGGHVLELPDRGKSWEILDPGIYVKRWPCCYANHRALAGIFKLAARHQIDANEVEEVAVGFLPDADKALIHTCPKTGLEAKFSIEYCAAAALADGHVGLESFQDAAIARPHIRELMAKVSRFAMPGEGSFSGVVGYTDVKITTARGLFSTRIEHTPGSPGAPMTPDDRYQKFIDCAAPVLGAEKARRLFDTLQTLETVEDVAGVVPIEAERGAPMLVAGSPR